MEEERAEKQRAINKAKREKEKQKKLAKKEKQAELSEQERFLNLSDREKVWNPHPVSCASSLKGYVCVYTETFKLFFRGP